MTTTLTKRLSGLLSANNTKRVATTGATAGASASIGGNTWGNSWGFLLAQPHRCWGSTWSTSTPGTAGSAASPSQNNTVRVSGTPAGTITQRVGSVPPAA